MYSSFFKLISGSTNQNNTLSKFYKEPIDKFSEILLTKDVWMTQTEPNYYPTFLFQAKNSGYP